MKSVEVYGKTLKTVDVTENQPLFKQMNFNEHMKRLQAA